MDDVRVVFSTPPLWRIRHRQQNIHSPQQSLRIIIWEELFQHSNLKYPLNVSSGAALHGC